MYIQLKDTLQFAKYTAVAIYTAVCYIHCNMIYALQYAIYTAVRAICTAVHAIYTGILYTLQYAIYTTVCYTTYCSRLYTMQWAV